MQFDKGDMVYIPQSVAMYREFDNTKSNAQLPLKLMHKTTKPSYGIIINPGSGEMNDYVTVYLNKAYWMIHSNSIYEIRKEEIRND